MRLLVHKHPRVIALEGHSHCLTIRRHSQSSSNSNGLKVPLPRVVVHLDSKLACSRDRGFVPLLNRKVYGCLGLLTVGGGIYVAVITGAVTDVALPLPYETVNRIFSVEFVSISDDTWDFVTLDGNGFAVPTAGADAEDYDVSSRVPHPCWEFRKLLLNGSFYFSTDFDLTSMLQNRGIDTMRLHASSSSLSSSLSSQSSQSSMLSSTVPVDPAPINSKHYQQQYMWNTFLMEEIHRFILKLDDLLAQALEKNCFFTTVIRGFAKTTTLGGGNTISIISKQSWKRAGTRFHSRGIDDNGYVANFVESEFIFYNPSKRLVFAFTQIRGSVPAFWEQDLTLINPKITVTRSTEATQASFDAHFTELCAKYNAVHIVNLLSKTKLLEVELLRRYMDLLQRSTHSEDLLYTHFDFHAETKPLSGGFAGALKLLPLIHGSLELFGWFDFDISVGEVVTRQDGILRVNCLDCLDRTNLIEQVVCQTVVEHILRNLSETNGNSPRDRARLEDMIVRHNDLWADNGDAISQIYTGTNALKSSFSRSGKMNLAGALSDVTKSVSRMYQNTFVDSKKQSIIDLLLGKDARLSISVQIFDPSSDYVTERLQKSESTYTSYNEITVFSGTFNVNASAPNPSTDLNAWLFPPENSSLDNPDIYAIGLQELIELNAGSILAGDPTRPLVWSKALQALLNLRSDEYVLLRTELMSSMCLFLFVKKSKVGNVTQVAGSSKKTGLGGITANKGACAVRFDYGSTSFALVTSHLAAGVNATLERHNDYMTIMLGLAFSRNLTLSDHDNIIWFGDLNYRLQLPNERCRSLIDHGAFDELQESDQLKIELLQKGGAFYGFAESRILFFPTYKFDKGTSQYDSSEKQRVPSWTDRVLYRSKRNNELKPLNYNSVMDVCLSDHKPVYSTFRSKVKFVDEAKKKQLSLDFYNAFKAENGDSDDSQSQVFSVGSTSARSLSLGFASDTLSELNLLDVELSPPKPPPRSRTQPAAIIPRKVPPPPVSRRVPPLLNDLNGSNGLNSLNSLRALPPLNMRALSPSQPALVPKLATPSNEDETTSKSSLSNGAITSTSTSICKDTMPVPLRRGTSTVPKFDISSAPLTPKSSSPAPSQATSAGVFSNPGSAPIRPMKPHKPEALSASKLETLFTSKETPSAVRESSGASTAPITTTIKPPPPRSRTTPSSTAGTMSMSEWKPLVPK